MKQKMLNIINLALILVCLNLGIQQVHAQYDREELIETISFSGASGPVNGVALIEDFEVQLNHLYEYYGSEANNMDEITTIAQTIISQNDPSLNYSVETMMVDYGFQYLEKLMTQGIETSNGPSDVYVSSTLELIPINGDLSVKNMSSFYDIEVSKYSEWTIQGELVNISVLGNEFSTVMTGSDGRLINVYYTSLDISEVEEVFTHLQAIMTDEIEETVYGSNSIGVQEIDGRILIVTYDQQGKYSISLSFNPADVKKALGFAVDSEHSY